MSEKKKLARVLLRDFMFVIMALMEEDMDYGEVHKAFLHDIKNAVNKNPENIAEKIDNYLFRGPPNTRHNE